MLGRDDFFFGDAIDAVVYAQRAAESFAARTSELYSGADARRFSFCVDDGCRDASGAATTGSARGTRSARAACAGPRTLNAAESSLCLAGLPSRATAAVAGISADKFRVL